MSIEATAWALKETRVSRPDLRLMLILLADFHSGGTTSIMPVPSSLTEAFPCSDDEAESMLHELIDSRFLWISTDAKLFAFPPLDWGRRGRK